MSEFKFACPFCGQHITADSSASGTRLECPTCFQKLIVPQAPTTDSKLILSAAKPGKPRSVDMTPELEPLRRSSDRGSLVATVLLGLIICGGVAAGYYYRHDLLRLLGSRSDLATTTNQISGTNQEPLARALWTSNLDTVRIPEALAAGSIHGAEFRCEVSSLTGGALSLRQGRKWPPDLAVAVLLSARHSEELSGKTFVVPPEHIPPVPMIIVRWKNAQGQAQKEEIAAGYAMKVSFGQATNGHMPGKIYLALPDEARSIVAGSFNAEIRKTSPPSVPQTRG